MPPHDLGERFPTIHTDTVHEVLLSDQVHRGRIDGRIQQLGIGLHLDGGQQPSRGVVGLRESTGEEGHRGGDQPVVSTVDGLLVLVVELVGGDDRGLVNGAAVPGELIETHVAGIVHTVVVPAVVSGFAIVGRHVGYRLVLHPPIGERPELVSREIGRHDLPGLHRKPALGLVDDGLGRYTLSWGSFAELMPDGLVRFRESALERVQDVVGQPHVAGRPMGSVSGGKGEVSGDDGPRDSDDLVGGLTVPRVGLAFQGHLSLVDAPGQFRGEIDDGGLADQT